MMFSRLSVLNAFSAYNIFISLLEYNPIIYNLSFPYI